MGIVAR